jgi:hypothetical protein
MTAVILVSDYLMTAVTVLLKIQGLLYRKTSPKGEIGNE